MCVADLRVCPLHSRHALFAQSDHKPQAFEDKNIHDTRGIVAERGRAGGPWPLFIKNKPVFGNINVLAESLAVSGKEKKKYSFQ